MRPTPSTSTYTSSNSPNLTPFWRFNSPLPYLFGGLALMLLLITAALILLACSFRKQSLRDTNEEKSVQPCKSAAAADCSPRIVVILAGADNPTHLAVPCSFPKPDSV